jgi:hypothetical protein
VVRTPMLRERLTGYCLKMTAYPSVHKPALDTPEPIELEFAKDT